MTDPIETQHGASIDYAARRRERAVERKEASHRRWWMVAGAALAGLIVLTAAAEAAVTAGRVHPGVTVGGVPVGGMTPDNAKAALRQSLPAKVDQPVAVTHGDERWEVSAEQVGLTFDQDAQVASAMAVGRGPDAFRALGARLEAWTGGIEVDPVAVAEAEKLDAIFDAIAETTDVKPKNATVEIEGTKPTVVEGEDGRKLDREQAADRILATFTEEGSRTVEAPVVVDRRVIDEKAAGQAAGIAEAMLVEPVKVTHKKESWSFEPADFAPWIVFKVVESTGSAPARLEPVVSAKKAARPVAAALGTGVGREAKNARFTTSKGRVTIVPSKDGIGPDVQSLAKALTAELKDQSADRVVELRTRRTRPAITTEKARSMGVKERIGTYTTTYESGNRPRVNNIHLLGDSLDGTLIEPGGTFSFNEAAGERTAEKGYQEAAAIVNGRLVPQLGGGVCQVGTTVFNAVFESGLPVVQRHNHSFYISHYPTGRDATVSWGGPDLKFKNDTKHWVLVSVSYSDSSITVSLYGTDPGYEVSAQVGEWHSVKPFPTEEVKDPDMPKGSRVVEDAGVSGRSITVKRTVTKDGKVVRTDSFVSNYKPKVQVVRVGTKSTSSKETTKTP